MLLFIVLQLSAQVLCTVRDTSLSRLIDEGFGVADEVWARDSGGFERVVSQFRGPRGPMTDVIPSWLLGGGEGTSAIHLGAHVNYNPNFPGNEELKRSDYEIEGMGDWIISYTHEYAGRVDLGSLAANELLHRSHYIRPVDIVYFSRPNPGTEKSWMYTIFDNGPRRLLLGPQPTWVREWVRLSVISFRQKCIKIQALMDLSLLLRRHPRIHDSADFSVAVKVDHTVENPKLLLVNTHRPRFRPQPVRVANLPDILYRVADLIHREDHNMPVVDYGPYAYSLRGWWAPRMEEFLRHGFFLDSDSPEPFYPGRNHLYTFKTLQEVLGDEFEGYDREYIRSKFREFVELVRHEWDQPEPNPAAIPSIVDLIEQTEYVLK
jgi:hypothetical protein